MKQAVITVLYDEGALSDTGYIGARGMSLLVDVDGERTMFDTGRRGRYLIHNMSQSGIDPESVNRLVISHGHLDHTGGIPRLLEERNETLPISAPSSAWMFKGFPHKSGIKIPKESIGKVKHIEISGWMELSEHLAITPPIPFNGGEECFLVIKTENGPVVISGCSHPGVGIVMDAVAEKYDRCVCAYIGGLHIVKKDDVLSDNIAKQFETRKCGGLWFNHCTSPAGMGRLRVNLGLNAVKDLYVGQNLKFKLA